MVLYIKIKVCWRLETLKLISKESKGEQEVLSACRIREHSRQRQVYSYFVTFCTQKDEARVSARSWGVCASRNKTFSIIAMNYFKIQPRGASDRQAHRSLLTLRFYYYHFAS